MILCHVNWFIFFQLQGTIDDCSCSVDTVDYYNNVKIYPRLRSLLVKDFFRYYKVNLAKECPYWVDDSKCAMRFCHVQHCEEKDIPPGLKGDVSSYHKVSISSYNCFVWHLISHFYYSFRWLHFVFHSTSKKFKHWQIVKRTWMLNSDTSIPASAIKCIENLKNGLIMMKLRITSAYWMIMSRVLNT